jgi:tetratricopeptide (TPR) repeat protein
MDSRPRISPTLVSLIEEFEQSQEEGRNIYLNDKEYQEIIAYYDEEGEFERALEVIELAIKQFSYRSDFLCLKGRLLVKKGKFEEAQDVIRRAELISPNDFELKILRINILLFQKNFNEAINIIDDLKSVASESEMEDVMIAEAFFYESIQEFDLMFQALKSSLIINPNNDEALFMMNTAVERSRNFEESILIHKLIVDTHPYNYLAWYNLGHAYSSVNEYEKAVDALEYSFIINPEFQNGYSDCADMYFEQQNFFKALEIYYEAEQIFGPDFDLLMNKSRCEYALGLVDKAKRSLFEAIEMDSYSDEAYFILAKCYMENKDWNSAIKVLKKAVSLDSDIEDYYHALAVCFREKEEWVKAKLYYKKAAYKGREQSSYWEDYVNYLICLAAYDEARSALQKADKYTFSYRLQYLDAAIEIANGEIKKGLDMLGVVLEEAFEDHGILFTLSSSIYDNKEVSSIISYYNNK